MKENEILEVLIEGMDKDGQGIAYYNKKIIFVKGALIGERCTIKITKVLSKLIQAEVVKIIEKSPSRITPDCPIASICGGCNMRHMSYDLEKEVKFNKVKNTITHGAKFNNFKINPLLSDNQINHYRNKAIVPLVKKRVK